MKRDLVGNERQIVCLIVIKSICFVAIYTKNEIQDLGKMINVR